MNSVGNCNKLLELKDLYVRYHTDESIIYAVNGVSFSINRGETLGLVGETGAGKTTTALSILKLLPKKVGEITRGSILINGKDITTMDEVSLNKIRGKSVSMIFQDPMTSLDPLIRVGDQIIEVLKTHNDAHLSKEEMEKRVDELLTVMGISPMRKHEYPFQFSGGMKQRVVIAIALAYEPDLIIADEPTTALDVTIQAQILEKMNDLKHRLNTSMLLITHDLGIVARMCDTVAIMYAGEIVEQGDIVSIFTEPKHPYTIGLFNSIPNMSIESDRLQPIEGTIPDPSDLPDGCKFHERCPKAMKRCEIEKPNIVGGSHLVRCHLFANK
jgi:peptide/nickel transport system ATP-binding protein